MIPTQMFLTKGVGVHRDRLSSFEAALRKAGIEQCNLVYVSSILPPKCKIIPARRGLKKIRPGQITYCVLARSETNECNRLIASAIGLAVPADKNSYGYLSEHHAYGQTAKVAGEYAEDLAATMLASTLGIDFDVNEAWKEREQVYKASGKIFKTRNIVQTAEGSSKSGLWTTAIAAAVLIMEG